MSDVVEFYASARNVADYDAALGSIRDLARVLESHADPAIAMAGSLIGRRVEKLARLTAGYPLGHGDVCDRCGHVEMKAEAQEVA